jgi:hypothetical protein
LTILPRVTATNSSFIVTIGGAVAFLIFGVIYLFEAINE